MQLQDILKERGVSMYRLAQESGVPKTTVFDICSGKSSISSCKAKTVQSLARALSCSMEDLMRLDSSKDDPKRDEWEGKEYFEVELPPFLEKSLLGMKQSLEKEARGEEDLLWDCCWCDLYASINAAEIDQLISKAQASYLRKKYLQLGDKE